MDAMDKPDRRGELIGVSVLLTTFSAVFVLARCYARLFSTRTFGWDDGCIFLSLAACVAGEGLTIACATHGLGLTISRVNITHDLPLILKYTQFAILCNAMAMMLMKLGIGLTLIRLHLSKAFNMVVIACIVLTILVNGVAVPGVFASCTPLAKEWHKNLPGKCWPKRVNLAFSYTQTVGNIVTDLLFTLGPLFYLSKVKVSKYNKWALRSVFLIGLLATACAIAKATELPKNEKTKDPTLDTVNLTIWVKAELAAGLFAASLPPLKATFERILTQVFGIRTGLTTPSATRTKGHSYGNSHTFRSGRRVPPGSAMGTGFEDDLPHGSAMYAMDDMKRRGDSEEHIMEEDQKHILHPGSVKTGSGSDNVDENGEWITKTVEFTVAESRSIKDDRV
ncbi:hypothetical protein HRR83_001759 [Exophiala dermatitidis]|uniref:Phosphatidylserine decarboxylase n=2 Tax=Exophiala dermatitidis TaxID=5970 RepID=H6C5D0_EXODN|nr:phosphatidylserine decarboxylase [Exophiala dermatitidis NIH/UT8656]KAJ4516427.1 hypothetical protein HRR73_004892 [Exophiala dermatitidis]EHY58977.1 phosphatidylserine decarboxylase [Exophiala dermatitidis NIH/UT8656]KAJ4526562.1 hypothetical protein HRR74_001762 [Exophiala dermatitidis]KAJ4532190.1 hypothetical protein HRR76_007187 [Exophiala dermatitidis]KAJ4546226.1 hypothetical protein HRR77_004760 [Exophiala dermatitidis]